jgi:hypothetical protein
MDKNSAGCDSPLFEAISKGNKEISGLFLTKLRMGSIARGMRS